MFNVKVDENYFYQGAYATVGKVQNGEDMPTLPPEENQLCYYIDFKEEIVTEQVPVMTYTKTVVSETEFDVYYEHETTNEEGLKTLIKITEEEYNALSDEEKENVTITSIPKITHVELTKEEYEALSIEEKNQIYVTHKIDEDGNPVYEDVEKTLIVKEWAFSKEKYDELEAQRIADEEAKAEQEEYEQSISPEAQAKEIEELKMQNEELIMTIDAILTEVIPSLFEEE